MDLDPKVTTGAESGSTTPENRGALPPTQNMSEVTLKGRYLVGPELGRGGFAITYLATDLELASRKVVVKLLNEFRSNDAWALRKFRSEMEALARIHHANVVSVIDFGETPNGKPFLVLEYVPGRPLRQLIPREGLPFAQVAEILKQTGRALTAAHEAGVCHRDLKPENILITEDEGCPEVKVIDFGIASILDPGGLSLSTNSSGTYVYMSPEQFHGKVSPASDIYQMGVVAYELVTGITPFRGASPGGLILQQMEGLRVCPSDLRPDLPEAAEQLILKALSPDPHDRFERARDFGDALAVALGSTDNVSTGNIRTASHGPLSTRSRHRVQRGSRVRTWLFAGIFVFAAILAGTYLILRILPSGTASVAVLPFENSTGDPQMAYLAEGITESLIDDLSRIPTLRVTARGAVLKYNRPNVDMRAAGRELGVHRLIDGSISRQGDEFFLDTELIDVSSGVRLWGNRYNGKISSFAQMLQQFSTEVTDQLRLKLSGPLKERIHRQYATDPRAYQQYLKGRSYLNKRTAADFQQAIACFNQAISADPNYAAAYSGLADTYGIMAAYGTAFSGVTPAAALEQARRAAKHALQLDGTLSEAYSALAWVEMQADYDWSAAENDFRRSIQLNPNWPDVHESYAFELAAVGRFGDALREIQISENADPSSANYGYAHVSLLYAARRFDDSLALAETPKLKRNVSPDLFARNYWMKSLPIDALNILQGSASALDSVPAPLLATGYARAGQIDTAEKLLRSYSAPPDSKEWYYLALAHLSLGRMDDAISDLEAAHDRRWSEMIFLGVDPMLDSLRAQPRFQRLLKQTKLS